MKKIIILLLTCFFCSCSYFNKKEQKEIMNHDSVFYNTDNEINKDIVENKNLLIKLDKLECSGDCPVFTVHISKDSILTFKGIKFVALEGTKTLKLTKKQYINIEAAITKANFNDLKDNYLDSLSVDFSKSIFTYNNKNVSVRLWKNAPEELTNLYVEIENILYNNKFIQ